MLYLYSITVWSAAPQTTLRGGPGPRFEYETSDPDHYCRPPHLLKKIYIFLAPDKLSNIGLPEPEVAVPYNFKFIWKTGKWNKNSFTHVINLLPLIPLFNSPSVPLSSPFQPPLFNPISIPLSYLLPNQLLFPYLQSLYFKFL